MANGQSKDQLGKCETWARLLHLGEDSYTRHLDQLIETGLVRQQGRKVILENPRYLQDLVDRHCSRLFQARDEARDLAEHLGLETSISAVPEECLELLNALRDSTESGLTCQGLSASLFGDSKHIRRTPQLWRIFKTWTRTAPGRQELRLKAFSSLINLPSSLNLNLITRNLGQVILSPETAGKTADFDFKDIDFVLTSENLSPFLEINLERGLLLFCPGYNFTMVIHWLRQLPESCQWLHFGDLDPDGLHIYSQLCNRSGRTGRFYPDITVLEKIKDELPDWQGARAFIPENYDRQEVKELASWGAKHNVYAEQEQVYNLIGSDLLSFN